MKTLEELRRRIKSVEEMQTVVSTMKSLAAARIRQFENAADATKTYAFTIRRALQVVVRNRGFQKLDQVRNNPDEVVGYIVFGTDQGFCGRFNQVLVESLSQIFDSPIKKPNAKILTIGTRIQRLLSEAQITVDDCLRVPTSVQEIATTISQIVTHVESWQSKHQVQRVELLYNHRESAASYKVKTSQLLPLSQEYLNVLAAEKWESKSLPMYKIPTPKMFSAVIRQHLFLQLFRACAESLASENASRIASMQQAEKNIEKHLENLTQLFNQNRQRAVTEELLDIVGGFEAVIG